MASSETSGRRRRRRPGLVVLVVLVLLAAALVAADFVVRGVVERQAAAQVESALPSGSTGTVSAKLEGVSALAQLASGRLDRLDLTSHDLVIGGVPLEATAGIDDVPLSEGAKTGPIRATVSVDEAAVNRLSAVKPFGTLSFGDGTVSVDKTLTVLGLKLSGTLTGTLAPADSGSKVVFTPTKVASSSLPSGVSGDVLLSFAKTLDLSLCVAEDLPRGASVSRVAISDGEAAVTLRSAGIALTDSAFETTGSCS